MSFLSTAKMTTELVKEQCGHDNYVAVLQYITIITYHYLPTPSSFFHLLGVGIFNSLPPQSTIDNLLLVEMLVGPKTNYYIIGCTTEYYKIVGTRNLESKLSAARGQGVIKESTKQTVTADDDANKNCM